MVAQVKSGIRHNKDIHIFGKRCQNTCGAKLSLTVERSLSPMVSSEYGDRVLQPVLTNNSINMPSSKAVEEDCVSLKNLALVHVDVDEENNCQESKNKSDSPDSFESEPETGGELIWVPKEHNNEKRLASLKNKGAPVSVGFGDSQTNVLEMLPNKTSLSP